MGHPTARWGLLLLLGLLSVAGYVGLWALPGGPVHAPSVVSGYLIGFGGLFALYSLACYLVLRHGATLPRAPTLGLIAAVAVFGRGVLLLAPPTLSDDVYRYVWDGRVQAAGLSPYAYPPGAAQVIALHPPGDPIWPRINRKDAITIYPPGAEVFYAAVYRLGPDSVAAMKAALVAVDLASCLVLGVLLSRLGLPVTRVLIYAWAPLPIVEFGGSGHVEALEVLCTLLALLAAVSWIRWPGAPGSRRGDLLALLAPACLAAAALVKLIPLLLLAAWARRLGWRRVVATVALFGLGYAAFVLAHGGYISPFLVRYLRDEFSNAPLYAVFAFGVAPAVGIPDSLVRAALIGVFGLLVVLVARQRDQGPYDFIGKCFLLVGAYLLLTTNAYQWYATWLLLFVPLLLPPGGLPIAGAGAPAGRGATRAHAGLAVAAWLYTGLTFGGYIFWVWYPAPGSAPAAALQCAWPLGTHMAESLLQGH